MALDTELFKGKKVSDVLEEIYTNSKKKDKQISALINQLKDHVNDLGDATVVVPMIKEYLDVAVKNDDALIKMLNIVNRMTNNAPGSSEFDLSVEELQALIQEDSTDKK
jgi:ferritin